MVAAAVTSVTTTVASTAATEYPRHPEEINDHPDAGAGPGPRHNLTSFIPRSTWLRDVLDICIM